MTTEFVKQPVLEIETKVSLYEQVSGTLYSGVIVIGAISFVLIGIWLSLMSDGVWHEGRNVPEPIDPGQLRPVGVAEDIEEPGVEEFPEVAEPMLADSLEAVDVRSTVRASDKAGDSAFNGAGRGLGDRRQAGYKGNDLTEGHEAWKHWQIDYTVSSIQEYGRQLDHFGVELAAAEKKGLTVIYCKDVSKQPTLRVGQKSAEGRIYFQHAKQLLRRWDLLTLQKAGVEDCESRTPIHFYPDAMIRKMYQLETMQLEEDGRKIEEVKQAKFVIAGSEGGYQFKLAELIYLN